MRVISYFDLSEPIQSLGTLIRYVCSHTPGVPPTLLITLVGVRPEKEWDNLQA